jgi:broad specificity phosphatase PhoE
MPTVGRDADRLVRPQVLELRGDRCRALAIAPDDGDARTRLGERLRGREPDARGAAGDEAGTPIESKLHAAIVPARAAVGGPVGGVYSAFMPLLLLVRHGETAWNAGQRWQGHQEEPLSPTGREQARALAARMAREAPAALYSSDLTRARETAEEIAGTTGLQPHYDARWREVDVGEWLGLDPGEVEARYPEGYARWLAGGTGWRQGESYPEMAERGLAAAREVVAAHEGASAPIVCVTHGGVIRSLVMHVLGMPPAERRLLATGPTATVTAIDATEPTWRLRSFNDSGHLPAA